MHESSNLLAALRKAYRKRLGSPKPKIGNFSMFAAMFAVKFMSFVRVCTRGPSWNRRLWKFTALQCMRAMTNVVPWHRIIVCDRHFVAVASGVARNFCQAVQNMINRGLLFTTTPAAVNHSSKPPQTFSIFSSSVAVLCWGFYVGARGQRPLNLARPPNFFRVIQA